MQTPILGRSPPQEERMEKDCEGLLNNIYCGGQWMLFSIISVQKWPTLIFKPVHYCDTVSSSTGSGSGMTT
jgi:hypothetical protein